jgi:hypothetical protein
MRLCSDDLVQPKLPENQVEQIESMQRIERLGSMSPSIGTWPRKPSNPNRDLTWMQFIVSRAEEEYDA